MKAVVAAFNQEKALVGAFSVITNLRMELFEALVSRPHNGCPCSHSWAAHCFDAALFAGSRWPWAGGLAVRYRPRHGQCSLSQSKWGLNNWKCEPLSKWGIGKNNKDIDCNQPAPAAWVWSLLITPGCRAAAVGNVGNVGLDVFPIGQRSRTQNRTDLSRTKTKGRGEGASSQAGREKCLTHSRSFQQQAKYFSVWLRWKINFDFWKKSHMFRNVLVGWWWMTKGGGGARSGSPASAVTGRHAACHYPNGGSLVAHYTPIPHYATFTHLLYSRKPKNWQKNESLIGI